MAGKRKELTCVSFVTLPGGGCVRADALTAEQRREWRESMSRRLGESMSAYFVQHPEEFEKV